MEKPKFPMRINKYLAHQGYATRREADELIAKKRVFINGRLAVLGDKVTEKDKVEVKKAGKPKEYAYYAYNKPKGIVTHSAQDGDQDIEEIFPVEDVFPVGRLDKDSHGLIILTNDGRVTDRLLNPDRDHDKEYVVRTRQPLRPSFAENMEKGVNIEGYQTKKCQVEVAGDNSFRIVLTEGKKHQIKRMVVAMHNEVTDLKRTRILNIRLGKLRPGQYRPIEGEELKTFLNKIGLA